jgi:PAS domain-containing protein
MDERGRQRGAILTVRDDTARHEAEQALVRSEARFREQFENANDFIFTADLEMRITSCNRRWRRHWGACRRI